MLSGRLVFTAHPGGRWDVFAMNADGNGVANLSRDLRFDPDSGVRGGPAFSPDGSEIAFVSARDRRRTTDGELTAEIYVMGTDGNRQRRLTRNAVEDGDPSWSPDGGRIAPVRRDRGLPEYGPAWPPDGRRLAFVRLTVAGDVVRTAIVVRDVANGAESTLADGPGFHADPAWSPDGSRLAFASTRDRFGESCFHDCSPNSEIYA